MDNKKRKGVGALVERAGKLYIQTGSGKLLNVVQSAETRKLFEDGAICGFDVFKDKSGFPLAINLEQISKRTDPIPEGRAIAKLFGLIREQTPEVREEVNAIPQNVTSDMIDGISDYRDINFVTIDPDLAEDYDDAVFAKKNPDGTYTLMVAIANVANYIKKDSTLFNWGLDAGNSSYLGGTCYPMYPEELSNGICSIREGEDRLVMCTTCTMNESGELLNYTIEPAVIGSKKRFKYKETDYLYFGRNAEGDNQDHSDLDGNIPQEVLNSLDNLYDVAQILNKARMRRGALDIPSRQLNFLLNSEGTNVIGYERDHAEEFTSVIEETAILKNEIWGEVFEKFDLPGIYRNHKSMENDEVDSLRQKLKPFGIKIPRPAGSKAIQAIINSVKGKAIEEYVVGEILKSMDAAYFDTENIGHAGLAIFSGRSKSNKHKYNEKSESRSEAIDNARSRYFKSTGRSNGFAFDGDISHSAYMQVTSPIRREGDTLNQMQMLEFINTGNPLFRKKDLAATVGHLNMCERNSENAEKIYRKMLASKWAQNNLGRTFNDCVIIGLEPRSVIISTRDGFHMELPYSELGDKKKFARIGMAVPAVTIAKVSVYPSRIICSSATMENIRNNEDRIL